MDYSSSLEVDHMQDTRLRKYWIITLAGTVIASFYPVLMGIRVIHDMIADGTVMKENYPKYIIPYTPIAFAVMIGVLIRPQLFRMMKKHVYPAASVISLGSFLAFELLFEKKVVITDSGSQSSLANWQMYLCSVPPADYYDSLTQQVRTLTPVEVLAGNYNPAFKLHFYLISVILILAILNSIYGFAEGIRSGDKKRNRALILQSVSAALFLGLCILACFTAFWRDGNIRVSPLSASLMALFFTVLGITAGIFTCSMLLDSKTSVKYWIPALCASAATLVMYIGELILLHRHLYILGDGFFFEGIPGIVLSPADITVILFPGLLTFITMRLLYNRSSRKATAGR